nr:LCP family protein [uncultured Peptostreptococcus sp.]
MSALKKFVIFLAVLVVTIPVVFAGVVYSKLKSMQINDNFDMLASNKYKYDNEIINILLVGSDARPGEKVSRSDSMMILTVDNKHKKLKLTSLGRDTYVRIPNHGFEKLTHAYAYGKEKLLIQTIEDNFKLDIQNYAKVDFFSFMDIVDALGGIDIDVKSEEIPELNKFVSECYSWSEHKNGPLKYFKTPGKQKLVGYQTLTYARIRKSDGTMERDDRQRKVIEAIIHKVNGISISKYPKLLDAIKPYVKTNMTPTDIMYLGKDVLSIGNLTIDTMQFPLHPENETRLPHAGYVIPFETYEVDILHKYIFDNIKSTPSEIEAARQSWKDAGNKTQYISNPEYMYRSNQ